MVVGSHRLVKRNAETFAHQAMRGTLCAHLQSQHSRLSQSAPVLEEELPCTPQILRVLTPTYGQFFLVPRGFGLLAPRYTRPSLFDLLC